MLGKNAVTRSGKGIVAKIADLVVVCICMGSSSTGTNMLAAKSAGGGAIVCEGVTDAVKCRTAVLANGRAGIETDMSAVGVQSLANIAVCITVLVVGVRKTGSCAANIANAATVGSGCRL